MLTTRKSLEFKYNYQSEGFKKAFDWLENTDLESLEPGVYKIDDDNVFAEVQEYVTKEFDECSFESHTKYYDIQYMVKGTEVLGYADKLGSVSYGYNKDRDLELFETPIRYSSLVLKENEFAIVSPDDLHQPRVKYLNNEPVKKIVMKVRVI